jgi:hypothetical protein
MAREIARKVPNVDLSAPLPRPWSAGTDASRDA